MPSAQTTKQSHPPHRLLRPSPEGLAMTRVGTGLVDFFVLSFYGRNSGESQRGAASLTNSPLPGWGRGGGPQAARGMGPPPVGSLG